MNKKLKLRHADLEDQLEDATEEYSRPHIDAILEPSEITVSEITVSKFDGFAERRVPFGHPSSNGKSNIMQSAFSNKLSESSRGAPRMNSNFTSNMHSFSGAMTRASAHRSNSSMH